METQFYENRLKDIAKHQAVSIYDNRNFSFRAHWHQEIELVHVRSGRVTIGVNKEAREMAAGDVCLFQSGDIHYYESSQEGSDVVTILFSTDLVSGFYSWMEAHIGMSTFLTEAGVREWGLTEIYELSAKMCREKREELCACREKNKAYATLLLIEIMRKWPCQMGKGRRPEQMAGQKQMQEILAYIEQHVEEPITITYLAEQFHMDKFYLSKVFNRVTGMHFKDYINRLRVTLAEEKLRSAGQSVVDIAYECGFGSVRNFNRVFKVIKGRTPGEIKSEALRRRAFQQP